MRTLRATLIAAAAVAAAIVLPAAASAAHADQPAQITADAPWGP